MLKNKFFNVAVLILTIAVGAFAQVPASPEAMSGRTALQYFQQENIKAGWNLGNTLDAVSVPDPAEEEAWNPGNTATQALFNGVKTSGFNIVRIPVTWFGHIGSAPDYTISQERLQRVAEVINYAKTAGIKAMIINIHHDGNTQEGRTPTTWGFVDMPGALNDPAKKAAIQNQISKMWTQIANYFKNYGEYLIFETLNEVHSGNWGYNENWNTEPISSYQQEQNILFDWNQAALTAIRSTGGNNETRYVAVPGLGSTEPDIVVAANNRDKLLPNDGANGTSKLIVAVHYYAPSEYTVADATVGQAQGGLIHTWGSSEEKSKLNHEMELLKTNFINNGIAVYLGEWGAPTNVRSSMNRTIKNTHINYIKSVATAAHANGVLPIYWDDGGDFKVLERTDGQPQSGLWSDVLSAIIDASSGLISPNPITGNLGNYTFGLEADGVTPVYNQAVWRLLSDKNINFAKKEGTKLVLELPNAPNGNIELVWQGPANEIWWKTKEIITWNTNINNFDYESSVTWDNNAKTLTINLSETLVDYESFKSQPDLNLIIAYYSSTNDVNDLGIISANLVLPPSSSINITENVIWEVPTGQNALYGGWYAYNDNLSNTNPGISNFQSAFLSNGGTVTLNGISGGYYISTGVAFNWSNSGNKDISTHQGVWITYSLDSDNPPVYIQLSDNINDYSLTNYATYRKEMQQGTNLRKFFEFSSFTQPSWADTIVPLSQILQNSQGLQFQISDAGTATLTIKKIEWGVPPTPPNIVGNLGNYIFGKNGEATNYELAVWELSESNKNRAQAPGAKLVLKMTNAPSHTMQLAWQGQSSEWQDDNNILSYNGTPINGKGATWDNNTNTLTINLRKALDNYSSFITPTNFLNLVVTYYNGNVNDLGIISANIELPPPLPTNITGNLGNYVYGEDGIIINEDEAVWKLSEGQMALAKASGTKFILEMTNAPTTGMVLAWQEADGVWHQNDIITWNGSSFVEEAGVTRQGNRIEIDLVQVLNNYPSFQNSTELNLIIAHFIHGSNANGIDYLGITKAHLEVPLPAPITIGQWTYSVYNDANDNGTSLINSFTRVSNEITINGNVTNDLQNGYIGLEIVPDNTMLAALKTAVSISFNVLGDGSTYKIALPTSNITDWDYYFTTFTTTNGTEKTISFDISKPPFAQGGWGSSKPFEKGSIEKIQILTNGSGQFNYTIKDLKLTYAITYELDGGPNNSSNPVNYTGETSITILPPTETKTGYTFGGWFDNNSFTGSVVTAIPSGSIGSKKLWAKWIPITYTVDYNGNGNTGGSTASSSHTYDVAKALTANGFTRAYTVTYNYNGNGEADGTGTAAYTFSGWKNGDNTYTNSQAVTNLSTQQGATVTLLAQWNSGSVTLPTPTRTGHTFTGWYTEESFVTKAGNGGGTYTPTENKTLWARWTPTYTIGYHINGGTNNLSNPANYTIETPTITLQSPTKTGYTFGGWFDNSDFSGVAVTAIALGSTGNKEFWAKWTPITYTVAYDGNGNTGGSTGSSSHTYDVEKALTANGFERAYTVTYNYNGNGEEDGTGTATYEFSGWKNGNNTYTNSQAVTNLSAQQGATVTLSAQWNPVSVTLPTPTTRAGYTFEGWFTAASGGTKVESPYTPTENKTLWARWTPITYTVAYDGNGSTGGSTVSSSHTYDAEKALTANGFTRAYTVTYKYNDENSTPDGTGTAAYTFSGWKDGDNTYTNSQAVKNLSAQQGATVTLLAQWTPASVTLPTPTRTGYTFNGWFTAANGGTPVTTSTAFDKDDEIYAQWTIKTYTVTFFDYDSTQLKQETVNHGSAATAPTPPTRTGYTFTGWDKNFSAVTGDLTVRAKYDAETPILRQAANNRLITLTRNGINLVAKTGTVIAVYNLNGKLISKQSYQAGNHSISFSHLPKGVYLIQAQFGSTAEIIRLAIR